MIIFAVIFVIRIRTIGVSADIAKMDVVGHFHLLSYHHVLVRYPFAAQVAPLPYSKSTPIEVTSALQRNQSILVSLAVSMNARSQSFYIKNGNLGWPVPSLKQLFSSAVTYKKKFQKGIISSWEGYNNNHVSPTIYLQSIRISEIV